MRANEPHIMAEASRIHNGLESTAGMPGKALECGSLLPLSFLRAARRDFDWAHDSPPTSWLVPKRQQAAAL